MTSDQVVPSDHGATAAACRMQPSRAGIVGLWDYSDQTFTFADGRLVLRGVNGSGKTKALEVLFPFVLDGRLDPRRLDPFSGDNRTMKENLLWGRDGESGYGYAWIEFGDGTRHVTVGVGMVARRSAPSPTPWFFVAEGRAGEEVVLVEPDGRPRTRAQLRDALGDGVVVERARDHRARVDAALFGLGIERYESMLDLVLTLRRPMLAKDLDPALLSDTLTRGLRPLDDDLLEQVVRRPRSGATRPRTARHRRRRHPGVPHRVPQLSAHPGPRPNGCRHRRPDQATASGRARAGGSRSARPGAG
jgi:hypothetical protein